MYYFKKYKLAIIDRPFEIPKLMKGDKMFGSRRVLKPHSGKTELAKERLRKASKIMVNNGANAGQSVFHLHMHLLSGRSFSWPPG